MTDKKAKKNEHPPGGERMQVLSRVVNSVKEDKIVSLTPCGLKLVRCTMGGVEEIQGFEELELRDKLFVTKMVVQIHEDIFNKHREIIVKDHAEATKAQVQAQAQVPEEPKG